MRTTAAKRIKRQFPNSDFEMAFKASVMHVHFLELLPAFVVFDATLANPYPAELKGLIDQCLTFADDDLTVKSQKVLTIDMRKTQQRCINAYTELRFFARRAFTESPAMESVFRFREFHKARYVKLELLELLQVAYDMAEKYLPDLEAHGYTNARHQELGDAIDAYNKAMLALDMHIDQRKSKTYERIELHNRLWKEVKRIHQVADHVFGAGSAQAKLFALPWPKRKKAQKESSTQAT